MKRSIEFAGGVLQAIEFVVFVCGAVALVAIGPFIWIYRLFGADRIAWAAIVALCWLGSVVTVGRDVRRGAITLVSFGLFLAWLVLLGYVFHEWFY
jgi:hypothetical protein